MVMRAQRKCISAGPWSVHQEKRSRHVRLNYRSDSVKSATLSRLYSISSLYATHVMYADI